MPAGKKIMKLDDELDDCLGGSDYKRVARDLQDLDGLQTAGECPTFCSP